MKKNGKKKKSMFQLFSFVFSQGVFSSTIFQVCKMKAEGELLKKPTYKIQHVLILQTLFLLPEVQGKGAELTLQIIRKK